MSESDSTVVPDQLASLISDEVERQLRERGSVLEAMKEQMAKVLAEFEEMAVNVSSKRSWSNSVARTKPFASPKKALFDIHPVVTPLDIVPSSPPKLPKISGGLLKNIHQLKHNASGGALPPGGARSPDGKITFDKILPRVAHIEKRTDGAQMMLSQQRQQMYERALVRYPQCRSNVFAPSMYDHEEVSNLDAGSAPQAPRASLELDFVYGCRSGATTSLSSSHPAAAPNTSTNNSAFYLSTGEIMWFAATLVILYRKEANTQRYFREHTNEVTSIAVHQNQRIVASGQAGRSAFLLVWNANDEPLGKRFACLKGHQVAVRSISFSHDGKLIASLGGDMYNTICIHDWKAQELLAYGRPETQRSKKPGQALHDDDACYTLASCGVRHIRFWTLTKLRPPTPTEKVWKLEGNVPSFHGRFEVQDFTSLTFVNDSPPLYMYDEQSKELTATNATDHSLGRIVAGTANGDLCLFLQPRASPNIDFVSEGDLHKEPAKWWEVPDEYTDAEINELVLEKIAYEPTARLVDIVPHDQETGNRFKLPKQAQAEMQSLSKKMALRPNSTALFSRLGELKYSGPLAHQGAAYQVAYSKKRNTIISCGNEGKLLLWKCEMSKPLRIPGVNTLGVFTPLTGTFTEGSHALLPLDEKVFYFPTILPHEASAGSAAAAPKPTSIVWKDDGNFVLVATSNSCVWELNVESGDWQLLFEARSGAVTACAAHPTMQEVGTVSQDGYLSIWDLRQHVCIRRLYLGSFITASVKAFCMEFHPAGSEIAIGLSSGELLVVDYDSFKVLLRKNIKSNSGSTANLRLSGPAFRAIAQVKYCPNAKFLAVGVKDTFVYIYDIVNGYKKLHICEGHSSAVMQLTWNKDGDILQSNATDGEILHWIVSPVKGETKQITDAFLVRDVQWIKWTCVFGWPTPGIWSEESPNLVDIAAVSTTGPRTANEYDECGNAHTTSNEDLLAVACRSSIHLLKYPAHRGAKRKVYKAHSSAISALGFSFDDAYLVTVGGDDGTLMQWSVVFDTTSSSPAGVKVPGSTEKDKSRTPFAEDDSTGEQWSSSSPAPPPQDGKQRSNQLSPRKNSRQYRERLVYQDDSSREPEPVGESLHRHPSEEEPISDIRSDNSNEDRSSQAGASGPPVERGVSYRGSTDLDEPRPAPVQVRATHDYAAESPDELNLNRGEILRVLSKAGSDWWLGETCDGTKGYFPASFVEDVDLSAPVSGDESVPNEDPPAEGCLRRVTQDGYSFGGSSWPFALMATPPSDTALGATSTTFRDLPLHEDVAHALTAMRFLRPSPIQLHALPVALFGNDVIGQAKSGTGKTAVFGVTAIEHSIRYVEQRGQQTEELMVGHPLALVLAPTREIAVQIESVLRQLAQFRPKLVIRTCIGGLPVAQDQMHLAAGCHIVVGTPGRVKALVDQCSLPCSAIRLLVLDEVDKLMARDFEKDIQYIADALPERRQTLAFSATFTPDQLIAVTQLMRTPQIVRVRGPGDVTTEFISSAEDLSNWKDREQSNAPELWLHHVRQFYSVVKSAPASAMGDDVLNMKAKVVKLAALLSEIVFVQCMVFCNDKFRAEALATALTALGWPAACITGAQAQATRLEVMEDFRASRSRVLVTTDLTARGIDVDNVNFVVNLDLPRDPATYLHRVGRTGRFGGKISFSSCLLH
ncbi:hypothetical protein PRIC1_000437 [Phytophthora ramorum]